MLSYILNKKAARCLQVIDYGFFSRVDAYNHVTVTHTGSNRGNSWCINYPQKLYPNVEMT